MNKCRGFTLLELLIAMSLSSFVIMGLFQSYYSLINCLERSRSMIITNRRVALAFNQIERDINCAIIPPIYKKIEPQEVKESSAKDSNSKEPENVNKNIQKSPSEKKDEEEKDKEKDKKLRKSFFVGESDDNALFVKIDGKKWIPFKNITFITTNTLQIYGQKRKRLVRVKYEIVKNKEKSNGEKECFNLVRNETYNLENENVKIDEFDYEQQKSEPIKTHIIAENLKGMYLEYVAYEKNKIAENDSNEEVKKENKQDTEEEDVEYSSFMWGDKEEYQGTTPRYVDIRITFWDEEIVKDYSFTTIFPILNYDKNQINAHEYDKKKEQEKKEQEKKESEKKEPDKNKKDSEDKDKNSDSEKKDSDKKISIDKNKVKE